MSEEPIEVELLVRIADGVQAIERNLEELRQFQRLPLEEYVREENRLTRDAVERKFEKLVAATVDVGRTILRAEDVAIPAHRKRTIAKLDEREIIPDDLSDELQDAVGFRDVLAHTYGPIIKDELVYDALQDGLDRFVHFVQCVDQYLNGDG